MTGFICAAPGCTCKADQGDLWCLVHSAQHDDPQTEQTHAYDATCHLCGSLQYLYLTDRQYRALRPVHCQRCGGRVFVAAAPETFRPDEQTPSRHANVAHPMHVRRVA